MVEITSIEAIREAAQRIHGHVVRTPALGSAELSGLLGRAVAVKLETLQLSGSFKARGITNRTLAMSPAERARGLIGVSGGNHGVALARVARLMGLSATVVMPESASARAVECVRADGAELVLTATAAEAFEEASRRAAEQGLSVVHPFDDPWVVAGQGTAGLEFIQDLPELTDVLVSVGGGGLIAGVAAAIKAINPAVRVWGVETAGAESMSRALAAGRPVPVPVSSIAATLGAPQVCDLTFTHVAKLVEELLVVSDAEAVAGAVTLAEEAKVWAEPASGALVAAARRLVDRLPGEALLGLVVCGGNVSTREMDAWRRRFDV